MTSPETKRPVTEQKAFWGFLAVGFISLLGGVFMFVKVVPPREPENIPRDVTLLFTQVFSQQNLIRNERGTFTPALNEVGVSQDQCRLYRCLLTVKEGGKDYEFRLTKEDRSWMIRSTSPKGQEITGATQ